MKHSDISSVLVLVFVFLGIMISPVQAQGQVGQSFGSLIYIDGKNVVPKSEIVLHQDELMSFECYDLMPGSEVNIRVRGAGSENLNETLTTNHRGATKKVLFFPEARGKLKCTVRYTSKNGKPGRIDFVLRPL